MSAYDDLLLWASEMESGSLESLRSACAWTATRVDGGRRGQDLLDDLLALGHVDVASGRWSVVPTTLVLIAEAGGNACFLGSRQRWFVEALSRLDDSDDVGLRDLADHLYDYGLVDQEGPGSWYVGVGPQAPLDALGKIGVRVISSASEALLQSTASANGFEERVVRPGELAGRLLLDGKFEQATISWEVTAGDSQPGTYRYLRNNQRVYAERTADGWLEMGYRWAVWRAAPKGAACAWYLPAPRRLYLPETCRLPLPLERALVLRTGRLPARVTDPQATRVSVPLLAYDNLSHSLAAGVLRPLGKEVEVV